MGSKVNIMTLTTDSLQDRPATLLHRGTLLTGYVSKDYGADSDGARYVMFTVTDAPAGNVAMVRNGETFTVDVSDVDAFTLTDLAEPDTTGFKWEAIAADAVKAEPVETEPGTFQVSVYLGTVFSVFPSGKFYTPFANSNVEVCEECARTDVPCDTLAPCNLESGKHCEACQDASFSKMLDAEAERAGFWIENGEGDATDIFATREATPLEVARYYLREIDNLTGDVRAYANDVTPDARLDTIHRLATDAIEHTTETGT